MASSRIGSSYRLLCAAIQQRNIGSPVSPDEVTMHSTHPDRGRLISLAQDATGALEALLADATRKVRARVELDGRIVGKRFDSEQRATHGLAWLATYVEARAPAHELCGAHDRARPFWRARGADRADRARRIPCPDRRRNSHEPGRDAAVVRPRAEYRRHGGPLVAGARSADRVRQHGRKSRAASSS